MGSIPACTGEPILQSEMPSRGEVYPRVYGGTTGATVEPVQRAGLSPRVRGNRAARAGRGL